MRSTAAVALTYFQLAAEDHRWWWQSVLNGGSTGIFILGYSIYFWSQSQMHGWLQFTFFMGYTFLVSLLCRCGRGLCGRGRGGAFATAATTLRLGVLFATAGFAGHLHPARHGGLPGVPRLRQVHLPGHQIGLGTGTDHLARQHRP